MGFITKSVYMSNRADVNKKLIDAPVEVVFGAFKDPEKLALWWGPDGFTNTIEEIDYSNGGYWRYVMHGPDGTDYKNESRFLEIIENRKIILEHISGHHFILTIEFTKSGNKTIVDWQQLFDTEEHYKQFADFVSKANQQNLDRLEAVAKNAA